MSLSYGKLVEITSVSGSDITFIVAEPTLSTTFSANMNDSTVVHPTGPHDVTPKVGEKGRLYLMKTWLVSKNIPILTSDVKWPLELSHDGPTIPA